MTITYWTGYSKKKNSTARPTSGTDATVTLKDDCSILNPVFDCAGVPDNVNYIYVSDFGRYYFVSDVVHITADRIQIHCSIDVLATYKSQIGGYNANVEYAASSTNVLVPDPRNSPTLEIDEAVSTAFDLTSYSFTTTPSTFIVGTVTDNGIKYCIMTASELETVCSTIYTTDFIQSLSNVIYDMKNIIASCIAIPYTPTKTVLVGGLLVGTTQLLSPAYYVAGRMVHVLQGVTVSVTFPDPGGLGYHSYLDHAPYTTGSLYLPYVGVVPLDLDIIAADQQFIVDMYLDICTGDMVYRLSKITGDYIATYQGNCATQIPVSGTSLNNPMGALASGISAIGGVAQSIAGIASGNAALVGGGVASLAGSAMGMSQSLSLHTQVNGCISSAIGSQVGSVGKVMIYKRRPTEYNVNSAFKNISGLPYFKAATISSLSGYVKCAGASVTIPGYDAEKDAVNGYLNSGFFYE